MAARQTQRLAFLLRLYDDLSASTRMMIHAEQVGAALGLGRSASDEIARFLRDEGLIEWAGPRSLLRLTHAGIVEAEQAIQRPGRETVHFPSSVVIQALHIVQAGSIVDSQIQQGTTSSQQTMSDPELVEFAREIIGLVRELLGQLDLEPDDAADVEADLDSAEAQIKARRPNRAVLRASLGRIVEGTIAAAAGASLADPVSHLTDLLHRL